MTPLLTGVFASQISGRLNTWQPTSAYDALSTVIVPSGGVSSITFDGIPQTGYSHLQIRLFTQTNRATYGRSGVNITFNNDSSASYAIHYMLGFQESSSASASNTTGDTKIRCDFTGTSVTNDFGIHVIDIPDYFANTKNKTLKILTGLSLNALTSGAGGGAGMYSGGWFKTEPIDSIQISPGSGETLFNQYSHFALYGVK